MLLLGFLGGVQAADPIISSIALVSASQELHFSASVAALASSISTLALAATVIATGLLADRLGRRPLLIVALGTAICGDLLVAASTNEIMYLLGRTVAGIGLGAVFAAAFAYVRAVAPNRMGAALGQFTAMAGVATLFGGLFGGMMVTVTWRLAYLVVPVLCALGILLIPFVLPKVARVRGGKIDILGLLLIAISTSGILYGVSQASDHSLTSPLTWGPVLGGVIALAMFVLVELRSANAVFPIKLFKSPVFTAAALAVFVWNFAQAVIVLQISNLWQYVEHYTPTMVTLGRLPLSVIAILASVLVGRSLARGRSARSQILFGFGCVALGLASLAVLPLGAMYWVYLPSLVLIGFGLPYVVVTSGQLYMSEAPAKSFGPVTSSKTTVGQFGYAIGLAGSVVMVDGLAGGGITRKLIGAGVPQSQTGQGLDAVTAYVNTGAQPATDVVREALQSAAGAYLSAFSTTMLAVAVVALTIGVVSYLLLRHR
ncbi:MAG: MFS transporter [Candidatus Woesebacteria bacterium]